MSTTFSQLKSTGTSFLITCQTKQSEITFNPIGEEQKVALKCGKCGTDTTTNGLKTRKKSKGPTKRKNCFCQERHSCSRICIQDSTQTSPPESITCSSRLGAFILKQVSFYSQTHQLFRQDLCPDRSQQAVRLQSHRSSHPY